MVTYNFSIFIDIPPGDKFDPDAFIATLEKQYEKKENYRNPSPPETPILYSCPIHPHCSLEKRETNTIYGHWEYYKCPLPRLFHMLRSRQCQVLLTGDPTSSQPRLLAYPLYKMKCYCNKNLYMSLSHSANNPSRLYLKCPKHFCDFFQWVDQEPRGKNKAWLKGNTNPLDPEL